MIVCTLCVGDYFVKQNYEQINEQGKIHDIHVLTDKPEYFQNHINIYHYNRNIFSYYEKITFCLDIISKLKKRVLYCDADWVYSLKNNLELDEESFYYSAGWTHDETAFSFLSEFQRNEVYNKFNNSGYNIKDLLYYHEALFSFPYSDNIDVVIDENKKLQVVAENIFNSELVKNSPDRIKKYGDTGIGYGEGFSISYLVENVIKSQKIFKNRFWFRNKDSII